MFNGPHTLFKIAQKLSQFKLTLIKVLFSLSLFQNYTPKLKEAENAKSNTKTQFFLSKLDTFS